MMTGILFAGLERSARQRHKYGTSFSAKVLTKEYAILSLASTK